ncbi:MAG: hypothetical protein M3Z75_25655 [Actinomycetota bacterium]|nr:hypothetical protein [Actinomycetota bacterium]
MTSVVSGERAQATWLTGVAGLLVLGAAVVMMIVAAPPVHPRPHPAAVLTASQPGPSVAVLTPGSRSAGRAGQPPNGARR